MKKRYLIIGAFLVGTYLINLALAYWWIPYLPPYPSGAGGSILWRLK